MFSPVMRLLLSLVVAVVVAVIVLVVVTSSTTTTAKSSDLLFCRIHHSDVLMIPTTTTTTGEVEDVVSVGTTTVGITECYPTTDMRDGDYSNWDIPLVHEVIVRGSRSNSHSHNEENFDDTSLVETMGHSILYQYLQYEPAWVHPSTKQIIIPSKIVPNIYHYDHPIVQNHLQQHQQQRYSPNAVVDKMHHTRHLQRIVTDSAMNKLLAVRVGTADEAVTTTLEEIEEYLFGSSEESFTSIHAQCTLGQKNIVPYNMDIPVYDITLDMGNSSDYTFGSFFTAAEPLIIQLLFGDTMMNDTATPSNSTDASSNSTMAPSNSTETVVVLPTLLSELVEYVVLIGPKGLRPTTQQPNFRFVAAGAYDSYKVVITDDWIDTPQVIQHEIGHNYNFGHPWEDNVIYGDTTSVMGQVYRNTIYNCYNGVHYHYAGWMENTTLTLDMTENATSMTAMMTDLAFYGHMDRITDPETAPTLIVMNGFFIMYNRAVGINAETNEYANGVLLHRYKEEDVSQSGTVLVAVLELSESSDDEAVDSRFFSSSEFDISVELCSQNDSTDDNTPDTVTLVIGTASSSVVCPDRASDIPSSSPVPTISPIPTISPVPSDVSSDTPTVTPVIARRARRTTMTRRQWN